MHVLYTTWFFISGVARGGGKGGTSPPFFSIQAPHIYIVYSVVQKISLALRLQTIASYFVCSALLFT